MSILHPLYFAFNPQGDTVTNRAHGLDISKYDLYFKPETATAQLDFVIQRISYRLTRDERFAELVPGVMSVPIRGGYHYLNSDKGWKEQADAYLSFISGYDYHFHACDFEGAYNVLGVDFAYYAWQWIHYVEGKTGKTVFLYTSPGLYNQWIAPSQSRYGINWNTVPLWTAQWFFTPNPNGTPSNPTGRTAGWKLWQYTDKGNGPLYGVSRPTACDLDVFNGTPAQMRDYLGLGGTTPPPPTEAIVEDKYFKVTTSRLNIRSSAANLGDQNDIGDLVSGDIVHAIELPPTTDGIVWHQIDPKVYRLGLWANLSITSPTGKFYAAEKQGTTVLMVEVGSPTPQTGEHILHVKDGVTRKFIPE